MGAKIETSLNFHVEGGSYYLQIAKYCALAEDFLRFSQNLVLRNQVTYNF